MTRQRDTPRSAEEPSRPPVVHRKIIRVIRARSAGIYRVGLLDNGAASLERFENGGFAPARVFFGGGASHGFDASSPNSEQKLREAVDYVARYLDGRVNVGERDLLSSTSAVSRDVRWFPGDIQMLHTAFPYAKELFPSAQFHVSQLFRRVFADAAFLCLILLSTAFWLRTGAPVALNRLAIALQVVSLVGIVGLDRYTEPFHASWLKLRDPDSSQKGLLGVCALPFRIAIELLRVSATILLNTLIGLTNLVMNPLRVWQSWRRVSQGRTLEWKASSVGAGQDVRGWPVHEFWSTYAPAAKVAAATVVLASWLILLGAPIQILGLNSLGIFVASFSTAALYAWYSALPHAVRDGAPLYILRRRELIWLMGSGTAGIVACGVLWRLGIFPQPGTEGSVAIVCLFLGLSSLLAVVYPVFYCLKQSVHRREGLPGLRLLRGSALLAAAAVVLVALLLVAAAGEPTRQRVAGFFDAAQSRWQMLPAERRVFDHVFELTRGYNKVDPEPLLRSTESQATLAHLPESASLDLPTLSGIPTPRLPTIELSEPFQLPELYPLPQRERIPVGKPKREFLLPLGAIEPEAPVPTLAGSKAMHAARRSADARTPRHLSPSELQDQDQFVGSASYPWIDKQSLTQLGQPDPRGLRLPLAEIARAYHWQELKALWDQVPAARDGSVPDRVRLARLGEGLEGVMGIGKDGTPAEVELFLNTERELIRDWTQKYPHLPLAATQDTDEPGQSRFFLITQFLLSRGMSRQELADGLALDYVNAHWTDPPHFSALHQVFRDRFRSAPGDLLELDWEGSDVLGRRWDDLQTEQTVATKVWLSGSDRAYRPNAAQLLSIGSFLDRVLSATLDGDTASPYRAFADLFALEGVDAEGLAQRDVSTTVLGSKVWTQTMSGRLSKIIGRTASSAELPGSAAERALIRDVAARRYPNDGGDPALRRALEWLVIVDPFETFRELSAGYAKFQRENSDRGVVAGGTFKAPIVSESEFTSALLEMWRELPQKFARIPATDDMVSEVICQTAYFSSVDGMTPRSPRQFLADFADLFADVDGLMAEEPPAAVFELADRELRKTQGRSSRSVQGRRFFAWWNAGIQAKIAANNAVRHHIAGAVTTRQLASEWADLLESGQRRYAHLPWFTPGFAEFFLGTRRLENWSLDALWQRFDKQLKTADNLLSRHMLPYQTFESVVDRRISEKTGTPNFDPTLRRANAALALAQLLEVLHENGLTRFDANPAALSGEFSLLYETLRHEYPLLYWDGEGIVEFYLLVQLRQNLTRAELLSRFAPEWSLANALAASGYFNRLQAAAGENGQPPELHSFVELRARRLEDKTHIKLLNVRARAMNALVALSTLIQSAAEEGLLPMQQAAVWPQSSVREWARKQRSLVLTPAMSDWTDRLLLDAAALQRSMEAEGPRFPWYKGSILETNLLVMRRAGASVQDMRVSFQATWRAASDIVASGATLPAPFEALLLRESMAELKQKIAAQRGVSPSRVSDEEVSPDDASLVHLNATLALSGVLAQIRLKYAEDADPADLARRFLELRAEGPARYSFVPWTAKGFVPSLIVAAYRPEFREDFWSYARVIDLSRVNQLMAEAGRPPFSAPSGVLPVDVLDDVRLMLKQQTGQTPASDDVVVFQALTDGVFLLKQFVSELPTTLGNVLTIVSLRSRIRALSPRYPELGIVSLDGHGARIGFAERIAAVALRQGLKENYPIADSRFVERCVALVEQRFLRGMQAVYERVRATFPPEEMQFYRETISAEARQDNVKRAATLGIPASALSVPDVIEDDVVADFALYETLYARELGQPEAYLGDVLDIFAKIRARPAMRASFDAGLKDIDQAFAADLKRPGEVGYEAWARSSRYAEWWERRGELIKKSRGKVIALARTFALLKQTAFSPEAEPTARAAFARFAGFDRYLTGFLDDLEYVDRNVHFRAALDRLANEDPFLSDGVQFAAALLKHHVIDRVTPHAAEGRRLIDGILDALPEVEKDYGNVLGFQPRLESGVPLYDARIAFVRNDIEGGPGTSLLRRLNLVQRSVQHWPDTYLLKHAYKVLFFRDLDENDPTPSARYESHDDVGFLYAKGQALLDRTFGHSLGDEIHEFLQTRLPEYLQRQTGSSDVAVWIDWLAQHGEVGLDGEPTGKNPYAAEVAGFEARIAHYRDLVHAAAVTKQSARAEEQRIRDIQKEATSLNNQLSWLRNAATRSSLLKVTAARDFRVAVWLYGLAFPCAVFAAVAIGVWSLKRRWPGRRRLHLIALAFGALAGVGLCAGLPMAVAFAPATAARFAQGPLVQIGLLQLIENGSAVPRGPAAQLAKAQPWDLLR